ncbi:MAG: tyrosine--tRNA ligase [Elusimicrobiales bacterium]|nr:tyrosine--tRNA ligase [Elusimicrobiales bacterium]
MNVEATVELLKRGCADIVSVEELEKKLESGKTLRVKLGADPTSPDLHLGHSVVLSKMRAFQDLGHTGVLVIGDFTACVGDPSGRDSTRPVLLPEQARANAETYKKQAFKILDPNRTEIRCNSEWLVPFTGSGLESRQTPQLLSTLRKVTLARITEREDFKNRIREGSPISLLELLYPILQGQDSVALEADVELGGADQIFNLLMGRDLQKDNGQEPQVVMTMPLLVGTDGARKMSKSYGNYVGLADSPGDIFGRIMSVSDELMLKYYELLTAEDIAAVKALHPMEAKKNLASLLVERLHSKEAAQAERTEFEKVHSRKELPTDMPVYSPKPGERLSQIMVACKLASGMNEARRLITQGAVKMDGSKLLEDKPLDISAACVLQVGSRRFCKLVKG